MLFHFTFKSKSFTTQLLQFALMSGSVQTNVTAPSEARLCAFLMKDERNERAKRIEWVSSVLHVAVRL